MRVSDYIVYILEEAGITAAFSITGGFAMHLNDSFGNSKKIHTYYQHHEQACGYAAVGYGKTNYKPSIVCVTAGAATTNCATPCLIAYQDSVPVLFINGQVKTCDTIRGIHKNANPNLRNYAFADCDITSIISPITKYNHEITSVSEVPEIMQNVIKALTTGRPGSVWLSVPLDIQGATIHNEIPKLISHIQPSINIESNIFDSVKRPIILAGNGINLAGCREKFKEFIEKYKIPVVTTLLGIDLIETNSPYFVGRVGSYGDRTGNFSIQNSDLVLVLGSSLSSAVVGYKPEWFAREARIIYVDNDSAELQKTNINYSIKLNCDINAFFDNFSMVPVDYSEWVTKCNHWKSKWMFEMPQHNSDTINPYPALKIIFDMLPENKNLVSMTGSIATLVWHMIQIKKNDKFIFNGQGDMGPDTPAAIGAYIAEPTKHTINIVGEGALQFNIQELQTIVHHKMPIKTIVFNNNSYGAIEITQRTNFKNLYGLNNDSGLSFPDTQKIAWAYGIHYISVRRIEDLPSAINKMMKLNVPVILEIFCCVQGRYPKLSAKKLPDGSFTSLPFEDMEPFLSRDEFYKEMIVNPLS